MARPSSTEFNAFYQGYIDLTVGEDPLQVLESSYQPLEDWLKSMENTDLGYAYAPGKWTVAQLLQHLIDSERIFAYRALCVGRGEQQSLPGFDENAYAEAAPAAGRKWKGLAEELLTIRKSTIILFRSLEKENAIHKTGLANNHPISVNAIAFIIAGHCLHHQRIYRERYI